jgi:glycosyltransferase involved in cell wall biosynthesis
MQPSGRLGFVPPRYGTEVVGGAEAVMREIAHELAKRGWEVDVLTTCARDHFTWENVYPPGVEHVDGVTVRRFPAVISTPRAERAALNGKIVTGQPLTLVEQERWMNDDVRVPELFHYLLDHSDRYRALVFAPYLFWPAYACGQVDPYRSILMPCLHDEPEAYLDIFQSFFASVRGLWFLSEPEQALAQRVFRHLADHRVVGSGLHVPTAYDPERFRAKYGVDGRFVLYAGRREGGKNWSRLLDGFAAAVTRGDVPLSLVTMGHGVVEPPPSIADRVVDLGFLPDEDRDDAFAAADAYIQPSRYESFSRTMMEAWLAGTLVIANGGSEVNRWHCDRSGAGLIYDDDLELEQCLRFVSEAPDGAARLASAGRRYVLDNYTWPPVLDAIEASLDDWLPVGAALCGS